MRTLAPLGHASRALFDELIQTEKLGCWFCRDGYYEIYLTESGCASAKEETRRILRYGFHPEVISGDALRKREPAINYCVVGAAFSTPKRPRSIHTSSSWKWHSELSIMARNSKLPLESWRYVLRMVAFAAFKRRTVYLYRGRLSTGARGKLSPTSIERFRRRSPISRRKSRRIPTTSIF